MKTKEIEKDMLDYADYRHSTKISDISDIRKNSIMIIELKYKNLLKDRRGISIDYNGILNNNYQSIMFEDILNILICLKKSETKGKKKVKE